MKILLTGGTGYIGSHVAVVLIEAGFDVILFDNLSNSQHDVVSRLESITSKKIPFVEGDIRDTLLLSSTLKDYKVDGVVHLAGLKAVGDSVLDPLSYFDNNVCGTASLLKAMQKGGIRRIVFSSSATVYGEPNYLPIDENHTTSSVNPYGRTKLHIEEMLKDLSVSDRSWRIVCLRYFNPVGAHQSGLIGESPKGTPNNLMPYIADVAKGVLSRLSIFGNDYETSDGTGVRDYIHVMDLADGHLAAFNFLEKDNGWDVINLGTGVGTTVLEMVAAFCRINSVDVPYSFEPRRQGDVASCYASADKARNKLNWQAKRGLDSMCESHWHWSIKSK